MHIVSIGYEFETHDISKLSLCDNGVDLVNTSISLRNVSQLGIERSDHSVKLPIHKSDPSYFVNEYIQERREEDNVADTQFYILNDIGDLDFADMLTQMHDCSRFKEKGIHKNDLYSFVSLNENHHYNIKFVEDDDFSTECQTFSGVEFVCTYLKPERSDNVIIDTFIDACSRILDHFSKCEPIRGNLFILDSATKSQTKEKVGVIPYRNLYHRANTNLYYLQTYDNSDFDYYENHAHLKPLSRSLFIPQMTVGIKATHAVQVIREFMVKNNVMRRARSVANYLKDYDLILEATAKAFGPLKNDKQRTSFAYFFFIIYTLYYYLRVFLVDAEDKYEYFKDSVPILSRYNVRSMFMQLCRLNTRKFAMDLCLSPDVVALLKTQDQTTELIKPVNKKFGDPAYSLRSYFEFCLKPPKRATANDWLDHAGITGFSSHFKIIDPNVIIVENRIFNTMIQLTMQNQSDVHFNYGNYGITLLDMKRFVERNTTKSPFSCGRLICRPISVTANQRKRWAKNRHSHTKKKTSSK